MFKRMVSSLILCSLAWVGFGAEKPNVIFIITDDQSLDSLGFMGGKVHTPRIDQMARDGLYLTDFNVTSTVCSPSRYSFLTGRYAGRCTGDRFMREHPPGDQTQVENIGELERDRWNLAKVLKRNGYRTGFVGKSHLINHEWVNGDWKKAGLEPYAQVADPRDPDVNGKMQRNHRKWCEAMKPYGFDYVDAYYCANLLELRNDSLNVHNLDWSVSKAFECLETSRDKPFFLYFSTTLHHGPAPWENRFSLEADPRMTGEGFVPEGFDVLPSRQDVLERNRKAGFPDDKAFALWLDDGVSFKPVLFGSRKPMRDVLLGELGHSRCVKTGDWKYIAVRYPEDLQKKIDAGEPSKGFYGEDIPLPYLTRNAHLGHHASKVNPHYFEADQLYRLKSDPAEDENVFDQHPEVAQRMKRELAEALKRFENRPFGEFTN